MSGATLYAFPTVLTAPVQQTRRCGRFPKNVINLQRIRFERNDNHRQEEEDRIRDGRRQVLEAVAQLPSMVRNKDVVGIVVCAIDADRNPIGWATGLCGQDFEAARAVVRDVFDWIQ